jgi:hypothetical protein
MITVGCASSHSSLFEQANLDTENLTKKEFQCHNCTGNCQNTFLSYVFIIEISLLKWIYPPFLSVCIRVKKHG